MPRPELIFLYGQRLAACTDVIDKHYAGYQTLQYMSAGAVELWVGERRHFLTGRSFWSAYPGPRFRFHAQPGGAKWDHRYIAFQGSLVRRWEREGLFPVAPGASPGNFDYSTRFDELLACSRHSDARAVRRAKHLIEGILIELAETPRAVRQPDSWLEHVSRALDAAAVSDEKAPNYAALSDAAGISERTLRRRFRAATGTTPHAYLLQCRTVEARRLLGETELPIKTIASRLGYADVYFFSRQFCHLTGVPPGAYRKSRQN